MAESAEYVYAEVDAAPAGWCAAPTEQYARQARPDELMRMAGELWAQAGKAKKEGTRASEVLDALHAANKDFAESFPLVVRWMATPGRYSAKAFHKFLVKYARAHAPDSKRGAMDSKSRLALQAEYPVLLFMEERPHLSKTAYEAYRREIVASLEREQTEFRKALEQAQADADASLRKSRAGLRARLLEQLRMREPA